MGIEEAILTEAKQAGLEEGIAIGIEKGLEKGLEKGIELQKKEIILKGFQQGLSTKVLAILTELSEQEVEAIIKQVQPD